MPVEEGKIENVSDTALWVASFRAKENLRPDAIFRDHLAQKLLGERGEKIAREMPNAKIMGWIMVVRTSAIDKLIMNSIENDGVDTIINLGAGLDTRPYRMRLPRELNWVEIDFPNIIDLKNEKLKSDVPVCNLRRIPLDLADSVTRNKVFRDLGSNSKIALIITEGVIPYLSNEEASSLATDLTIPISFKFWIQDYHLGNIKRRVPRSWIKKLKAAPFKFKPGDWFEFFTNHGWISHNQITVVEEAEYLRRPFPFVFPWSILMWIFQIHKRRKFRNMNGYVTLKKNFGKMK